MGEYDGATDGVHSLLLNMYGMNNTCQESLACMEAANSLMNLQWLPQYSAPEAHAPALTSTGTFVNFHNIEGNKCSEFHVPHTHVQPAIENSGLTKGDCPAEYATAGKPFTWYHNMNHVPFAV